MELNRLGQLGESPQKNAKHLGCDADWQLHEDVAIAALTCGHHELGVSCWKALQTKFPKSTRVRCIEAMCYEATGKEDDALSIYSDIIAEHPANTSAHRRQVRPVSECH